MVRSPFSWRPYETSPKAFRTSTNSVRPMVDLRTEIAGVRLRNPTMLASGFLDETGGGLAPAPQDGAGAAGPASSGPKPPRGAPTPPTIAVHDPPLHPAR